MDPYVAGVLVGIGSAAVVIAVMAAVRKKQGQPKAEYDERQLAARGICVSSGSACTSGWPIPAWRPSGAPGPSPGWRCGC